MPFFLILLGFAMLLLAWQNNQGSFMLQLGKDFSGGFFEWFGAVLFIGALGYVPGLRTFSRGIMGLLLLVFILTKGNGIFSQVSSAIGSTPTADAAQAAPSESAPVENALGTTSNPFSLIP